MTSLGQRRRPAGQVTTPMADFGVTAAGGRTNIAPEAVLIVAEQSLICRLTS